MLEDLASLLKLYAMTSLNLFSFPNANHLFSFSLMLDKDCWAMEIIWRNLETD